MSVTCKVYLHLKPFQNATFLNIGLSDNREVHVHIIYMYNVHVHERKSLTKHCTKLQVCNLNFTLKEQITKM